MVIPKQTLPDDKILELFRTMLSDLEFWSAGKWYYNESGKKVTDNGDVDGTPIHSNTNIWKAQLDNKYIIIDADGCNIDELEQQFPSIKNTFTTQTTQISKRHYYLRNPGHFIKPTRSNFDQYDILTTGIIFEKHSLEGQQAPWLVINDTPPIEPSAQELKLIETMVSPNTRAYANQSHIMRIDRMQTSIIHELLSPDTPVKTLEDLPTKDWNNLARSIMNQKYRDDNKGKRSRLKLPPLNYLTFNTIAYKLSYNGSLSHNHRDTFMDLLLKEYYSIDPNSNKTEKMLGKQILPTLPMHNDLTNNEDLETFRQIITPTIINGYGLIKYVDKGDIKYLELDAASLKPRRIGKGGTAELNRAAVQELRGYGRDDFDFIPRVNVIDDPFSARTGFDDDTHSDIVNLSLDSQYFEQAVAQPHIPDDNVLYRLITSVMGTGDDREFYLHWLAHIMYNNRPPQTVPVLVSPPSYDGSTGKSSLAQAIPTRLIYATGTIDYTTADKGWGDAIISKRLVCFNDLANDKKAKNAWPGVHAFIRDRTTGGARRNDNMKGRAFQTTESPTGFSLSANWIPPIDDFDRRLWYVLPKNIPEFGTQEMLSKRDASSISYILENTPLAQYHDELQELANYLLYIFKEEEDKYRDELYITAPHTPGRDMALMQDRSNSAKLLPSLLSGPEALEDIVGKGKIGQFVKFIIFQYHSHDRGYVTLPWEFLALILQRIHGDDEPKNKRSSVARALDLDITKIGNQSSGTTDYRDPDKMKLYGFTAEYLDFSMQQVKLDFTPELIAKYEEYAKKKVIVEAGLGDDNLGAIEV